MLERQPPLPLSLLSPSLSVSLSLPCYSMLGNVEGHSFPIVYVYGTYIVIQYNTILQPSPVPSPQEFGP